MRYVSMPSWELFEALPQAERDAVLRKYGFSVDNICVRATALLAG